jgi:hypothetical protein
MSSIERGGSTQRITNEPGIDPDRATRTLLAPGMLVGPLYLAVGLAQALVRDGFDFGRHPLSVLANGPGGWVQTANFVLSGLIVLAVAAGFGRALGPKSRAVSLALYVFGASMIAAAVFPADPVDGFPPGTPEGAPTSISTIGLIHFIAGTLGIVSLAVSCFFAASSMSRLAMPSLSRLSLISGLIVLFAFFGGAAFSTFPAGIAGIWASVVTGWAWLAIMSWRLYEYAQ